MGDTWDPEQYERFRAERSLPFHDLLALVRARPNMRVIDLGCGTGELTRTLHQKLAAASTLGIDDSGHMLERARLDGAEGLHFEQREIRAFARSTTDRFDLVFSNAALQWLPDHEQLLGEVAALLDSGGQLAVQIPANHDHPSHLVARQVAAEAPFAEALGGYARISPVLSPEQYAERLDQLGFAEQHVRLQVYPHHLPSSGDVVEWVKGTLLTDYERRLPPELFARFLARYRGLLLKTLGDRRPYFYAFKRILLWASR